MMTVIAASMKPLGLAVLMLAASSPAAGQVGQRHEDFSGNPGRRSYQSVETPPGLLSEPGGPLQVGSDRQLFLDEVFFDRKQGVRLVINPPVKDAEPVLKAEPSNPGGGGWLYTELQDEQGQPIPGFTLDDCDTVNGNYVDSTVRWNDQADVSSLAGKPVRMRVRMRNTKLYAFQFAE